MSGAFPTITELRPCKEDGIASIVWPMAAAFDTTAGGSRRPPQPHHAGDESDAWRLKQLEICQLQEANKTLLRRVASSPSGSFGTPTQQRSPGGAAASLESLGGRLHADVAASVPSSAGPSSAATSARRSAAPTIAGAFGGFDSLGYGTALASYLPSGQTSLLPLESTSGGHALSERRDSHERDEHRRLAEEAIALRAQALELHRQGSARERELREQRAAAERGSGALARVTEMERQNEELRAEIQRLETAKELIAQLNQSEDMAVAHKTVRSYIENDLTSMRAERQNAEALLRAQTAKWQEQADGLAIVCAGLEADVAHLREENYAAEDSLSRSRQEVDGLRHRHAADFRRQRHAAEAAVTEVERRVQSSVEVLQVAEAKGAAAASAGVRLERELEAHRTIADHHRERAAFFERSLEAQGQESAEEVRQLQETLEQHEVSASEGLKRLKRDTSRKSAEIQARGGELKEETEELAAKAKESERTMHARLATARQERQRAEAKLKNQLQAMQAEMAAGSADAALVKVAEDTAERYSAAQAELQDARQEYSRAESESTAQRQRFGQTVRQLRQENEALHRDAASKSDRGKEIIQAELVDERIRLQGELWGRISVVEERHSEQLAQLRDAQARELMLLDDRNRLAHGEEKVRIAAERAQFDKIISIEEAKLRAEHTQLQMSELSAAGGVEEVIALQAARVGLLQELETARAETQHIAQQHEALVAAIKKEHEMADSLFQQQLRHAEEKQRRLGRLQHEAEDGAENEDPPQSPDYAAQTVSTTSRAVLVQTHHVGAPASLHSVTSSRSPAAAAAGVAATAEGGEGVDTVLQALTRDRNARRAQRLGEGLKQLLATAEWNATAERVGLSQLGLEEDDSSKETPSMLARALLHQNLQELLTMYDQAMQTTTDEERRVVAGREREATLRAQIARLEARAKANRGEASDRERARAEAAAEHVDAVEAELRERLLATEAKHASELPAAHHKHAEALQHHEGLSVATLEATRSEAQAYLTTSLALMEARSSEDFRRLHADVDEGRQAVREELSELRRALKRELQTTREEQCFQTRREQKLEAGEACARELAEVECRLASQVEQELEALRHSHADELAQLEDRLEEARLEDDEEKLNQPHTRMSGGPPPGVGEVTWQVQRRRTQHRMSVMHTRLKQFEEQEESREQEMHSESIEQQVQKHKAVERDLKEQLRAVREERLKERTTAERLTKQLRQRLEEVEHAAAQECRKRDLAINEHHRKYVATAEQLQQVRKASKMHSAGVVEGNNVKVELANSIEDMRIELAHSEAEFRLAEERTLESHEAHMESKFEALGLIEDAREREATFAAELLDARQMADYHQDLGRAHMNMLHGEIEELREAHASGGIAFQEEAQWAEEAAAAERQRCEALSSAFPSQVAALEAEVRDRAAEAVSLRQAAITLQQALESKVLSALQALPLDEDAISAVRLAFGSFAREPDEAAIAFEFGDESGVVAEAENSVAAGLQPGFGKLFYELARWMAAMLTSNKELLDEAASASGALAQAEAIAGRRVKRPAQSGPQSVVQALRGGSSPSRSSSRTSPPPQRVGSNESPEAEADVLEDFGGAVASREGRDREAAKKLALVQKELIKLREENQELRLEQQRVREAAPPPRVVLAARSRSPGAVVRPPPQAADEGGEDADALDGSRRVVPRPLGVNGPLQVDLRSKLKELQKSKVRAESEVMEMKHEMVARSHKQQEKIDALQNSLWDLQQQHEAVDETGKRTAAVLQRRVRILEGKLRDRVETCRALTAEKESVEEQLNSAVRQLEALLADEHKEGDLQRDLVGLSKQFEQLHGRHRTQLARSAEQSKQLQTERESRLSLQQKLQESANLLDVELAEATSKHDEQMAALQESMASMRRKGVAKDRELQEALSEHAAMTVEASKYRSLQQQQAIAAHELQEEVRRMRGELERKQRSLAEAWEKGAEASTLSQHNAERACARDVELERTRLALESAEAAASSSQAKRDQVSSELRACTAELGDARKALNVLTPSQRIAVEHALKNEAAARAASGRETPPGGAASGRRRFFKEDSLREDSGCADDPERSRSVRVRTARDFEVGVGSQTPPRAGQRDTRTGAAADSDAEMVQTLKEIQSTLRARERELQEHKAEAFADASDALSTASCPYLTLTAPAATGALSATAGMAAASPSHGASQAGATGLAPRGIGGSIGQNLPNHNLQAVERDFSEIARSMGFRGDVGPLWEEARAQAANAQMPPSAERVAEKATIATLPAHSSTLAQTPSSLGYPQSPPDPQRGADPTGAGGYPVSPGRSGEWLSAIEASSGGGAIGNRRESGGRAAQGVGAQSTASDAAGEHSEGLPASARETFRRAETLCEQQQFSEAVPLFQRVLQMLSEGGNQEAVPAAVTAEVWAHLGVAMQSLDRVAEAIDCYKRAVLLDPSLHVCFANLATLHAYLHENERALGYISKALALDPPNPTYDSIRRHLESSASSAPPPTAPAPKERGEDASAWVAA